MRRDAMPLNAEQYREWIDMLTSDHWVMDRVPQDVKIAIWGMTICGLRVSEAAAMSRSWYQEGTDRSQIRIPSRDGDWTPKNEAGSRLVPLPVKMECHHSGEVVKLPADKLMSAYFVGSDCIGSSDQTIRSWVYKIALQTNLADRGLGTVRTTMPGTKGGQTEIPDIMPHDLRASWAAQCLRSGVKPYTVREWGGWSNMGMVERYAKFVGYLSEEENDKF